MQHKMGKKEAGLVLRKIHKVQAENRRKGLMPETDEDVCRRYGFPLLGKKRPKKDQNGILSLAGACAKEAKDLERWKKEIYANRRKQSLRTSGLRIDEITSAFEKEAKEKGISRKDLLDELESVRKARK